ncbi:MAG: phosphate/phosphite/phosphonate ABC transporter substrate-binding protein, partial [Deltaproteobacteria bacterium]|nr:phosphate/phosphite/phosphonate ABC transporter substrate-binding protein [Deltaproteobacteria bacterium]
LSMHESADGRAILRPLGFDRFIAASDKDYDAIREMLDTVAGAK